MHESTVVFRQEKKTSKVSLGNDILDAANQAGIDISAVCGGRGLCGKCRVIVTEGKENLEHTSYLETLSLSDEELRRGYRLACCVPVVQSGTVAVDVPPESRLQQQRLLVAGIQTDVPPNPAVRKYQVRLTRPSLANPSSDAEILLDALVSQTGIRSSRIGHHALAQLPAAIREGDWIVTVTVREGDEVICVEPGNNAARIYGLAVDIGSTKVAAYLIDLSAGKTVATASATNPQIPFGEDIISRISYVSKSDRNLKKLQGVIAACINKLLDDACRAAGVSFTEVCDVVVVGNTAMHHIFFGITPQFVALSPYPPVIRWPINARSKDVGLRINPGAYVYSPPIIAGFVGADATADVLATEISSLESPAMMIDIGTNTEIAVSDGHRLISCSCASGPAFEGGHIEQGMRAEPGAIEKVYVNPDDLEPGYKTVEDAPPRGICGSGVVDAIASMLKCGIIRGDGGIETTLNTPRIQKTANSVQYVLAWKEETPMGHAVAITQHDIQEIQLAKAAIFSGATVLMAHLELKASDIEKVFLAGAFGTYVDPQSALMIGMYPDIPLDRVQFAGNSAGSGARMTLLSRDMREKAEEISRRIEYVELAADPSFEQEFMKALYFPHKELDRFPTVDQLLAKRGR